MSNFARLRHAHAALLLLGATCLGGEAAADQVIADDLIVQGSGCFGFDCVDGEVFGFATIILKENNTRILFNDTSVGAFPANDWQLTANDSASGGANKFSIEDITGAKVPFTVTAGAPTDSLFIDSSGRIGLHTSTPVLDLHINTSNTPAIRLDQNNSGGFTAQTWDVAGNEANFFVRDVTGGSRLPFRIRPGAPTSSIDIAASGNVGIGTASPRSYARLEVKTSAGIGALIGDDGGTLGGLLLGFNGPTIQGRSAADLSGNGNLSLNPFGGSVGVGVAAPTATLHTAGTVRFAGLPSCASGIKTSATGDLSCITSSRQFKTITGELDPTVALTNVMAMRPHVGAYKASPDEPEHWLIAEDVAAIDPALVGTRDGAPYTVKIQGVVVDLVAVIQQQQRRIEALERAAAAR